MKQCAVVLGQPFPTISVPRVEFHPPVTPINHPSSQTSPSPLWPFLFFLPLVFMAGIPHCCVPYKDPSSETRSLPLSSYSVHSGHYSPFPPFWLLPLIPGPQFPAFTAVTTPFPPPHPPSGSSAHPHAASPGSPTHHHSFLYAPSTCSFFLHFLILFPFLSPRHPLGPSNTGFEALSFLP